jgi:peptide/nickel transport system substrate-binding protein
MTSDFGPTAQAEVRRAVGYLFDRNVFLNEFLGGYGSLVNGPYGEAQWFFQETKEELAAALTNYTLDEDKANTELDNSTYKFEADGVTAFDPAKATKTNGYYRHDASKKVLEINHLGTTENQITVLIGQQLDNNFWKAGIKFSSTEAEWDTLYKNYNTGYSMPESERKYHLFNLATNYYSNYDPYYSWHSKFVKTDYNPGGVADAELDELTIKMRQLEATETEKFKEYFVDFIVRWNELLPTLPLYSNEYFDVINNKFTGLETGPVWRWSQDICDIKLNK